MSYVVWEPTEDKSLQGVLARVGAEGAGASDGGEIHLGDLDPGDSVLIIEVGNWEYDPGHLYARILCKFGYAETSLRWIEGIPYSNPSTRES